MLKTYQVMAQLRVESVQMRNDDLKAFLHESVSRLAEAAIGDLATIGLGNAFLERATVYVGDPTYRQSATTVTLVVRADPSDEFAVGLDCLIDHEDAVIAIVRPGTSAMFERARQEIERCWRFGYETSLREVLAHKSSA